MGDANELPNIPGEPESSADNGATPSKKRARAKDGDGVIVLSSKPAEFVFAAKKSAGPLGAQMLAAGGGDLIRQLKTYSGLDVEVVRTLQNRSATTLAGPGGADALLVRIEENKGRALQTQSMGPSSPIWVEANEKLTHFHGIASAWTAEPQFRSLFEPGASTLLDLRVVGEGGQPLAGALVTAYGLGMPVSARTGADGVAQIAAPQDAIGAIVAIVVDPASMHWSKVVRNPDLQPGRINMIRVSSFAEYDPQFSAKGAVSWGVLRLGAAQRSELTGAGVKIGVIDSGCDVTHPLLSHIKAGSDHNPNATADSWKQDEIGHGTHCAGVIGAASSDPAHPVRGMAPGAELYIYKVFPDGSFFTLADAMDAAIADGVDILSMSLGSDVASNVLAERFARAREAGVACIVAAGNSGDGVKFPANLSSAVAVAAMGFSSAFPPDSISAQTFAPTLSTSDGYFSPTFTCFGDSIDFAAPGVGIISTVPDRGLKAMDGTSMAAPHVSGLAALALAHDPALRAAPKNAARVDMLVARLREMAVNLPWGPARRGSGMPVLNPAGPTAPRTLTISTPWGPQNVLLN